MTFFITRYTFEPYFDGYFQEDNFYSPDGKQLHQRYYNGRLCISYNRKIYGIIKLRKFAKKQQVKQENLPF